MRLLTLLLNGVALFGFDPRMTLRSCRSVPFYVGDYLKFRAQRRKHPDGRRYPFGMPFPCLADRFAEAGDTGGCYFRQDLHVAQRVFAKRPATHFDVGSRVDGFVAHVASFREITLLDIRPLSAPITNVRYAQADLTGTLPGHLVEATDSLSCLHALEHFGLGRYGDPILLDGHVRGFLNLLRVLKKGGTLYLSVPIGPQRIEFNGQRVFSTGYLLSLFEGLCAIAAFSYIDDQLRFHEDAAVTPEAVRANFGCHRGCGIFELTKL